MIGVVNESRSVSSPLDSARGLKMTGASDRFSCSIFFSGDTIQERARIESRVVFVKQCEDLAGTSSFGILRYLCVRDAIQQQSLWELVRRQNCAGEPEIKSSIAILM